MKQEVVYSGTVQKFIPEGTSGEWSVNHFELTKKQVDFEKMRGALHPRTYREVFDLEPGKYVRLLRGEEVVMSDTPMELRTQHREVEYANGDCLVGGLGLGIFVLQIQAKPEVKSVLVIEKEQDVINLVRPHLSLTPKVTILRGNIFDKEVINRKRRFDFIFFDIWSNVSGDNAVEVGKLKRRWRPLLQKTNPQAWIGAWRESDFNYLRRESYSKSLY